METSHWQWTVFGWEKLYSTSLAKLKQEKVTGGIPHSAQQHWLHGTRKVMQRNKYPGTEMVRGSLDTRNSRTESKAGGSMNSVRERKLLPRHNLDNSFDNIYKNDKSLDDLAEICLSTSVIPSILLHDRLTEDLKKHSSMSEFIFDNESLAACADPGVGMVMPWNVKDVRSNCDLYEKDIGYHHLDKDASDAQVNYQMESYLPRDFDGRSTRVSGRDNVDPKDPSYYFMMDACPADEMRFLDNSDLCDENLVDDLLREIDDVDDIDQTEDITVDRRSIQNDAHGESEAERMKRQLSLMGKNEKMLQLFLLRPMSKMLENLSSAFCS